MATAAGATAPDEAGGQGVPEGGGSRPVKKHKVAACDSARVVSLHVSCLLRDVCGHARIVHRGAGAPAGHLLQCCHDLCLCVQLCSTAALCVCLDNRRRRSAHDKTCDSSSHCSRHLTFRLSMSNRGLPPGKPVVATHQTGSALQRPSHPPVNPQGSQHMLPTCQLNPATHL